MAGLCYLGLGSGWLVGPAITESETTKRRTMSMVVDYEGVFLVHVDDGEDDRLTGLIDADSVANKLGWDVVDDGHTVHGCEVKLDAWVEDGLLVSTKEGHDTARHVTSFFRRIYISQVAVWEIRQEVAYFCEYHVHTGCGRNVVVGWAGVWAGERKRKDTKTKKQKAIFCAAFAYYIFELQDILLQLHLLDVELVICCRTKTYENERMERID